MINWIKQYINERVDRVIEERVTQKAIESDLERLAEGAARSQLKELVQIIVNGRPDIAENNMSPYIRKTGRDRQANLIVKEFQGIIRTSLRRELENFRSRDQELNEKEKTFRQQVRRYVFSDNFIKRFVAQLNEYQVK